MSLLGNLLTLCLGDEEPHKDEHGEAEGGKDEISSSKVRLVVALLNMLRTRTRALGEEGGRKGSPVTVSSDRYQHGGYAAGNNKIE